MMHGCGRLAGVIAVEVPAAGTLVHGHSTGQCEIMIDVKVTIDRQIAADRDAIHDADAAACVQRAAIATDQRAVLDGAAQVAQTAGAKQAAAANIQCVSGVVQRAGQVHRTAWGAIEGKHLRSGKTAAQVQDPGGLIQNTGLGPAGRCDVQRATAVPGAVAAQDSTGDVGNRACLRCQGRRSHG